jgi:predicted ATPase
VAPEDAPALQVATGLVERFPDGVWFVELAALLIRRSARTVVTAGLALRLDCRWGLLTCGTETGIALLDNCEHLLAACASLARLLRGCPRLQVLATSRKGSGLGDQPVPRLGAEPVGSWKAGTCRS